MNVIPIRVPPPRVGTCKLCGAENRELRILYIGEEYADWTCSECIEQICQCQQRRYVPAGEQTEPGE